MLLTMWLTAVLALILMLTPSVSVHPVTDLVNDDNINENKGELHRSMGGVTQNVQIFV
jgi:hypothetical protein